MPISKRPRRIVRRYKKPIMPVGVSDFKAIIEDGYYYVDKTLLIKDMLPHKKPKVVLIARPRRFGKTLNLTMLRYFFEKTCESNAHLFENKKIWRDKEARSHQGQYPVVFLTLKETKADNWAVAYDKIKRLISNEYMRHREYVSDVLVGRELQVYEEIINETASQASYELSLKFLVDMLRRKSGKQAILLLDEYDTPITVAYQYAYYDRMIGFLRSLLGAVLKDSEALGSGVVSGISRIAKEGIFSDLNNLTVYGVIDEGVSDKFGFTEAEVADLLADYNLTKHRTLMKEWFDGYSVGSKKNLYNPWSVINCVYLNGEMRPYWGRTGSNLLIQKLILKGSPQLKKDLEHLLQGETVTQRIEQGIIYPGIEYNSNAVWSLLLYTGYVTFAEHTLSDDGRDYCALKLPNREMKVVYEDIILDLMSSMLGSVEQFPEMVAALVRGDVEELSELLQSIILKTTSFFDVDQQTPENSYHMFLVGVIAALLPNYATKSNREGCLGKADITLIPYDMKKAGVIIEIKKVKKGEEINEMALRALRQIKDLKYATEMRSLGINKIFAYGMAFEAKKVAVTFEELT